MFIKYHFQSNTLFSSTTASTCFIQSIHLYKSTFVFDGFFSVLKIVHLTAAVIS